MLKPTAGELRTLTVFFQKAAKQYGLYDWKARSLREGAESNGIFQKNLEILRQLTAKKGVDLRRIEKYCDFCQKEKRQVEWINQVMPELVTDLEALDRNLLREDERPIHRLLINTTQPVSKLDPITGVIVDVGDFVHTAREEFTMGELLDRFAEAFGVHRTKEVDKSLVGAMNYLLSGHSLDAILYAIDYARADDAPVTTPLTLQDKYLPEAEDEIRLRKARRI